MKPGRYPAASRAAMAFQSLNEEMLLGFLPLVEHGLVDTGGLIADCKSGVSGAGRGASLQKGLAGISFGGFLIKRVV